MANSREKYPWALPEGAVLNGRFIVGDVLGQGGFGITYKAQDHKTKDTVVIKEFFPETMASRNDKQMIVPHSGEEGEHFEYGKNAFINEAQTLAEFIGNEGVVNVRSYFEENGTAYFAMDYVQGLSFQEYIEQRGGRIPWEEALDIITPVMDALSSVHAKGIIHRDVTPDNIFITDEGQVKLIDFGAAVYSLGQVSKSLDVVLKHGYAPKEQYTRHGRQGPYTDVYSLAATFYTAVTGRLLPDSIDRMDEDEIVLPHTLGISIPDYMENAMLAALAVQPQYRIQNMTDFKNAMLGNSAPAVPVYGPGGYPANPSAYQPGGYPANPSAYQPGGYPANPSAYQQGGYPANPSAYQPGGYPGSPSAYQPGGYPGAVQKKKAPVAVFVGAGLALVLVVVLGGVFAVKQFGDDKGSAATSGEFVYGTKAADIASTYEDDEMAFSIGCPGTSYAVSRDGSQKVTLADSASGSTVDVHFAYRTTPGSEDGKIFYSAAELSKLLEYDPSIMDSLLGISGGSLSMVTKGATPAGDYYLYDHGAGENASRICLFDGTGDYGCYIVKCSSKKAALENDILATFAVTGKFEPGNYRLYENDNLGVSFLMPNGVEAEYDTQNGDEFIYIKYTSSGGSESWLYLSDLDSSSYFSGFKEGDDATAVIIPKLRRDYTRVLTLVDSEFTGDPKAVDNCAYDAYVSDMKYIYDGTTWDAYIYIITPDYKTAIGLFGDKDDADLLKAIIESLRYSGK
ncbi:MAG: protein kinase [Lachnospiraceae bacterium]|nr:protein kinase [Lachnospiraceae bacterium]